MSPGQRPTRGIFASLFIATATAQVGLGIISPILPLYARTFAATGLQIGLVFAAFSVSRALLGPFIGRLSDRIGRKPIIVAGLVIYAAVSVLYAWSSALWQLGVFRFVQGIASVMVTPIAQAYVGDLTRAGSEGRTLNAFYASQFIGMAIGPILGGGIGAAWSYEAAFYVMGGLTVLSLALVLLVVPTDETARTRREPKPAAMLPLRQVLAHDAVKAMLAYFATRGFWRQAFSTFYPLYAVAAFAVSEAEVGIVLSAYMFAEGLLQIPFGYLADRYPRVRQIVIGSVFAPLVLLAIPFVGSLWAVVALTVAMGAFSALGRRDPHRARPNARHGNPGRRPGERLRGGAAARPPRERSHRGRRRARGGLPVRQPRRLHRNGARHRLDPTLGEVRPGSRRRPAPAGRRPCILEPVRGRVEAAKVRGVERGLRQAAGGPAHPRQSERGHIPGLKVAPNHDLGNPPVLERGEARDDDLLRQDARSAVPL